MNEQQTWLDLDQVTERLCVITAQQLGLRLDQVKPESRLIEDLHCDSLDMIELIMETEDAFGVTIPETPSTPVGKMIFTRSPFRLRDLAEFAFLNQGTGPPQRRRWRRSVDPSKAAAERSFSQLGGRWERPPAGIGSLFEAVTTDSAYPIFRRTSDGMLCVQIPAGAALIGSATLNAHDDEMPPHVVNLSSFLIDIEPVSVTAFCRFLNSIDADPAELDLLIGLPPDDDRKLHLQFESASGRWTAKPATEMQPVVLVSWFAANAYSLWANGMWANGMCINNSLWPPDVDGPSHLPSEAQWEYAAQGAFDDLQAIQAGHHQRRQTYDSGMLPIANVYEPLAVSKFGLRHMSGTLWQWCCDWFDPGFYLSDEATSDDPINRRPTGVRSERGGSWVGPLELCRPSYRRGRNPAARGRCLGFRCVSEVPLQRSSRSPQ